jgi:S1-C subfamily serine protease
MNHALPMLHILLGLLRLGVCAIAVLAAAPASAQAVAGALPPARVPELAAAIARQFDVVVTIGVVKPQPDMLTDEELDGLGFSAQDLVGRGTRERAHPLSGGVASGFIISSDGHIITNAHVVADVAVVTVRLRDGRPFSGRVVGRTSAPTSRCSRSARHADAGLDRAESRLTFACGDPQRATTR